MKKNTIICCLVLIGLILQACNSNKTNDKHRLSVTIDSLKGAIKPNVQTNLTSADISREQLELINRKGFDRSILSYDTTDLIYLDSMPFRLLSEEQRHIRMPTRKKIAERILTKNFGIYNYRDKDWVIKSYYPGVLAYYPSGWGNYAKKIEYRSPDDKLKHTMYLDVLTPYTKSNYKNIQPGGYDFESMTYEIGYERDDYATSANSFKEDRYVRLQKTTDWTVVNYKLIALDDVSRVIGYETTLVIYDQFGKIRYRKKLPFNIRYPFISTDNRYLVYAPSRADFMPDANDIEGELFVVDLESGETIYVQAFEENFQFRGLIESAKQNLLSCSFTRFNINRTKEYGFHFLFDLTTRTAFFINKDSLINTTESYWNYTIPILRINNYNIKKY